MALKTTTWRCVHRWPSPKSYTYRFSATSGGLFRARPPTKQTRSTTLSIVKGKRFCDYARNKHPQATVKPGWAEGFWRIVYPLPQPVPLLSYVIPTGAIHERCEARLKIWFLIAFGASKRNSSTPTESTSLCITVILHLHNNASSAPSGVSNFCNTHPRLSTGRRKSTKAWRLLVEPTSVF